MRGILGTCAIGAAAALIGHTASAAIIIDGDFSDWAAVAPIATSIDNGINDSVDFAELKVSHDDDFVYLMYTMHRAFNPQAAPGGGVFLSIDSDNDVNTGFNVFGLNAVGSEAAWQNDFPFEQATGVFNTGAGLSNATYAAAPFNASTLAVEVSIPRIATRNTNNALIIPADGESIGVLFYTDAGASLDFIGGTYTFVIPEPATLTLLGLGGLVMAVRRRAA